jgi:hypothetical protein
VGFLEGVAATGIMVGLRVGFFEGNAVKAGAMVGLRVGFLDGNEDGLEATGLFVGIPEGTGFLVGTLEKAGC